MLMFALDPLLDLSIPRFSAAGSGALEGGEFGVDGRLDFRGI